MARKTRALALAAWGALALGSAGCAGTSERPDVQEGTGGTQPGAATQAQGGTEIQQATRRAMARIDEAAAAVEKQQLSRAKPSLDAAIEDLRGVSDVLPGEPLFGLLGETIEAIEANPGRADLTELRTAVQEMRPQLEPAVVRAVEDARFALLAGNPEQAVSRLTEARVALGADSQRLPVARVEAQLVEARQLLANRDVRAAQRTLADARGGLEQIQRLGPLVPVRWNFRGAAAAADAGDWEMAERLLAESVGLLETMRQPRDAGLVQGIEEMEAQARTYLQRIDGAQRPTPQQLRELASRTLDVRAG
ncbi:hypothetical protein [Vulgatibacter sp.]|uniref:hypothetical protein n=1 Tax=Vulgatibacter sp. TaxID=1971226 RepID=UPI0035652631